MLRAFARREGGGLGIGLGMLVTTSGWLKTFTASLFVA